MNLRFKLNDFRGNNLRTKCVLEMVRIFKAMVSNVKTSLGDTVFLYYFAQVLIRTKLIKKKILTYYTNFWAALFCWRPKKRRLQTLITWIVLQMTPSISIFRILPSKCFKLNYS